MGQSDAVAIVGMACRLPGATDLPSYWTMLRAGAEGITRFDVGTLLANGADPELVRRPDFVPAMGVLTGSRHFDWGYFGYSRAEAASIDPQQRIFLECAVAALDDAAIDPTRFPGWIGVYGGADRVSARPDDSLSEMARYIGTERDFLATRVAYKLGLRGPALTVQTACSTSLAAVHLAVSALRSGECDAALAGGVAVMGDDDRGYLYEPGGILSPDGHCRPFDAAAGGTVPSEGVGLVVLKRLTDAIRDQDRITAIILGSAMNNDGAEKMGYTAPSVAGQSEVIRHTQKVAGVDPADIEYVEAHGTGTRVGDPVEVRALTDVYQEHTDAVGWCRLGGVKSNIGHTGSAAGVAGLIKTAMMIRYGEMVPTVHFQQPNPLQEMETTPFWVTVAHEPWPDRGPHRLAAVSSFGVGGTNVHAVLGAGPRHTVTAGRRPQLLTLSATVPEALDRVRRNLAEHLTAKPDVSLDEVAGTLAHRRAYGHRRAVVATSVTDAAQQLDRAATSGQTGRLDRVALLFPGHGLLTPSAGHAAHRLLSGFRDAFDEIRRIARDQHGLDLSPIVEPGGDPAWFRDIVHHQVGLFAVGYALGHQVREWGVRPMAMLGNSIGEFAPATLAGLWSLRDAVGLVYLRAGAMSRTAPGRMVVVSAEADVLAERLTGHDVTLAVRAPGRTVVAGGADAVTGLLGSGRLDGLTTMVMDIPRAFHSPLMDPAADELATAIARTATKAPRGRLVSNATGEWADPQAMREPGYWARQLRQPVLLAESIGTLLDAGGDTFLELGPGSSMIAALRGHRSWSRQHATVAMLGRNGVDATGVLRACGILWERGVDRAVEGITAPGARCVLPGYPFAADDPKLTPAVRAPASRAETPVLSAVEQAWCDALGVTSVAPGEDFFALGGESLTAVNLLSRIRELTGMSVPVLEFIDNATFGHLTELVGAVGADDDPVTMLRLRPGDGRPVFLIADWVASGLSYRTLAESLDGPRPVHALEPAVGDEPTDIEAVAAAHVSALRRIQPAGPYTVGGWSFGATVAHEVAHQLIGRGEHVDVVICLDGYVRARSRGVLLDRVSIGIRAALGVGAVGKAVRRNPALRDQLWAKGRALGRYEPRPIPARAVILLAGPTRRPPARLGSLYGGGVHLRRVAGDHWSMLKQPHAGDLARELGRALVDPERTDDVR